MENNLHDNFEWFKVITSWVPLLYWMIVGYSLVKSVKIMADAMKNQKITHLYPDDEDDGDAWKKQT